MAIIIKISREDTEETIRKKLNSVSKPTKFFTGFDAKKYTGKIKSFSDGVEFQRKLRDEWN